VPVDPAGAGGYEGPLGAAAGADGAAEEAGEEEAAGVAVGVVAGGAVVELEPDIIKYAPTIKRRKTTTIIAIIAPLAILFSLRSKKFGSGFFRGSLDILSEEYIGKNFFDTFKK